MVGKKGELLRMRTPRRVERKCYSCGYGAEPPWTFIVNRLQKLHIDEGLPAVICEECLEKILEKIEKKNHADL